MPEPPAIPLTAATLTNAALAFRGYNQTNLGRTPELVAAPAYREIVQSRLAEASRLCESAAGRRVDLFGLVQNAEEPGVDRYAESIALVFAAELAQLDLLREVHGVEPRDARMAFGYSLGELTALVSSGLFPLDDVMRVPLALADDCASLAAGVTMAIVFSRKAPLSEELVKRACEEVTVERRGAIAISAVLSPNTLLVIGAGDTVERLKERLADTKGPRPMIRTHDGLWPPLHTPLVCEKHIPDRATLYIRETARLNNGPRPPVWSMVTGRREYEADSGRDVLRRWVDSPQRLWDVVEATLSSDVRTIVHVGPEPNVIPATFQRLADNVVQQTLAWSLNGMGLRAVQRMAGSTWLAPLLPRRGCLLRAPMVKHIVLEDWLLANAPGAPVVVRGHSLAAPGGSAAPSSVDAGESASEAIGSR